MIWYLISKLCARPAVANWLIRRVMQTPDAHLPGYMERFWLFNPYTRDPITRRWPRVPFSIRIHHILRANRGRDGHDHPWNARTIILRGWYDERRLCPDFYVSTAGSPVNTYDIMHTRKQGDTATIDSGQFHTIDDVSEGGVWTLFIVGPEVEDWGFMVDGVKVLHDDYFKLDRYDA